MIGPVAVVAGTDPVCDPLSRGARLCESRDGMLSVLLWLLRSRTAQFMATLHEEIGAGEKNEGTWDLQTFSFTEWHVLVWVTSARFTALNKQLLKLRTFSAAKGRLYACLTWRQCGEMKEKNGYPGCEPVSFKAMLARDTLSNLFPGQEKRVGLIGWWISEILIWHTTRYLCFFVFFVSVPLFLCLLRLGTFVSSSSSSRYLCFFVFFVSVPLFLYLLRLGTFVSSSSSFRYLCFFVFFVSVPLFLCLLRLGTFVSLSSSSRYLCFFVFFVCHR